MAGTGGDTQSNYFSAGGLSGNFLCIRNGSRRRTAGSNVFTSSASDASCDSYYFHICWTGLAAETVYYSAAGQYAAADDLY